jgi:hypothetical protein
MVRTAERLCIVNGAISDLAGPSVSFGFSSFSH